MANVDGYIPVAINHDLLGVNADHRAAYNTMTNTVFLAAQMDFLANPIRGLSETISNMFSKAAKHYYGVQVAPADATALATRKTYDDGLRAAQDVDADAAVGDNANVTAFMDANPEPPVPTLTDKRMYRKNSAKMETKRFQKELESGSKGLGSVPEAEREKVTSLKNGLATYFTDHQDSEPADLLIAESDDLFRTLQIYAENGARVLFIGKYKTNDDGKVDAYCRFVFLKHTDTSGVGPSASANLVIKNNAVVTGSGTGWGVALSKLLRSLFGTEKEFTFAEEARGPDVVGRDGRFNPYSTATENISGVGPAPVATPAEVERQGVADAQNTERERIDSGAAGPVPPQAMLTRGGKSTRRKRKGSRKKGSTKKPVSHKKRKSGASKKGRSHPKKK